MLQSYLPRDAGIGIGIAVGRGSQLARSTRCPRVYAAARSYRIVAEADVAGSGMIAPMHQAAGEPGSVDHMFPQEDDMRSAVVTLFPLITLAACSEGPFSPDTEAEE